MNVFIAGMVRAGSMWTYNVTRASLGDMGYTLVPGDDIPVNEGALLRSALQQGPVSSECYCIKSHEYLPLDILNTFYICNHRDVRDAMLSHMRFMKFDFEHGLKMVQAYMNLTDHYCDIPRRNVLRLAYNDMVSAPVKTVREINAFLGREIDRKTAKQIAGQFDKSRVKALLKKMENVSLDQQGGVLDQQQAEYTSAANVDGTHRAYHRGTGFSGNHITSTKPGEWRYVLDASQQERLMDLSRHWLIKYGYTP